uniref:Uncharacterized protein n=1 Tax=Human herpesvirus 2 TaxID=10310 RepID=A0A481TB96_HHV2|nr:hypothetical protein [Human alphaherpesvirus 2]QBH78357.1 hypothetical protein [Human alphaherpesvirus 2]QBH82903.1 hypothetical protein [Human alphaherpesvirus 2]
MRWASSRTVICNSHAQTFPAISVACGIAIRAAARRRAASSARS